MENSDGFLSNMKKIERTKILPLRWIGNALSYPATRSLVKAFDLQDEGDFGYRFKFHCNVFKYLNKPYEWWGTVYSLDLEQLKKDVSGKNWDDYDEDGIAYWEKLTDGESQDS